MIDRFALLVIVAACGSPSPHPISNQVTAARPRPAGCPVLGHYDAVWLHELFPGCPAMPFMDSFQVCAGECPHPCRSVELVQRHSRRTIATYTYDANGNWLSTRRDENTETCEHVGGRISSCGDGYEQWKRRADGRLVALETGSSHERWMSVTYDQNGDTSVLEFPGFEDVHRFVYDAAHRMLEDHGFHDGTEQVVRFGYAAGRLASSSDDMGSRAFSYDERGRLIRVANTPAPGNDNHDVVNLEYDDQDRIVNVIEDPRYYGGPQTTTYDYTCR